MSNLYSSENGIRILLWHIDASRNIETSHWKRWQSPSNVLRSLAGQSARNLTDHDHPDTAAPFQDYTRHQVKVNDDNSSH